MAKRTDDNDERKAIRAELEARRAELEALYRANVPEPGDERDKGLRIAAELQRAIEDCVDSLRANRKPEGALDRLWRMRQALHEVRSETGLAAAQLVRALHTFRPFLAKRYEAGRRTHRTNPRGPYMAADVIAVMRKNHGELFAEWTDDQITNVLRAPDFLGAMTAALAERGYVGEHGRPMGRENVKRLLKKR
jgi:hypothetical protein